MLTRKRPNTNFVQSNLTKAVMGILGLLVHEQLNLFSQLIHAQLGGSVPIVGESFKLSSIFSALTLRAGPNDLLMRVKQMGLFCRYFLCLSLE